MTDEQILAMTPSLPRDFQETIRDSFLWNDYFFTWRDEATKEKFGYCTACKHTVNLELGRTWTTENLEALQRKHNQKGKCPHCGTTVQWKDKNRGHSKLHEENYIYLIQHLRNGGLLLRSIYVMQDFRQKIENVNFEISEQERIYYVKGEIRRYQRIPTGYWYMYLTEYYRRPENEFHWSKMSTIGTPTPLKNRLYGAFYGDATLIIDEKRYKEDEFKYFNFDSIYRVSIHKIAEMLQLYYKNPVLIERMEKEGFKSLVDEKVTRRNYIFQIINWKKKTVPEALKLNREQIKRLPKQTSHQDVYLMQFEGKLSRERIKDLEILIQHNDFKSVKRFCKNNSKTLSKAVKYLAKHCQYIYMYNDYLEQLDKLQIPKTDKTLYPSNFTQTHENCTLELNRRAKEKELAAAKEADRKFKKKYLEYKKDLEYSDNNLIIRPAKGSEELLTEGTLLHHCVYTNYSQEYLSGKTIICLIRSKSDLDKPFYTLELSKNYTNIIQCRGLRNCGMTEEVKSFVDKWFKEIQLRKETKKCKKTA